MTRFAIDPQTLLLIVREDHQIDPSHQLVAPNSIRSQVLDLLMGAVASGELQEQEALELHERITELKMRLLGDRVSRRVAWQIARENGWSSVRDAEYLAVAKLQADALVASNPQLLARAAGLVDVAPFDALVTR